MPQTHLKFSILCSLVFTVGALKKDVCKSSHCTRSAEMFLENMDPNILPCHNFYDFMCGNFRKIHPLEPGKGRASAFTLRQRYVDGKILEFMNDSDFDNLPSVQKAKDTFKNCMDEATIERMGEATIPIELNTIGLPIKPPFNVAFNEQYEFSRLLAKVHQRSVFTKFLFDVSMEPYEKDPRKIYLHFDHTPSVHQFRTDENSKDPEIIAFRSHFDDDEKIEKRIEVRPILEKSMKKVVNYMNALTNAPYSIKTNKLIENRIGQVVDFLGKINKIKTLENRMIEGRFGIQTKITVAELQKITDEILGGDEVQIKINWLDYFETLFEGIREDARQLFEKGEPIVIRHMQQFKATLKVLSEVSRQVFICALWWSVTQSVSPVATKEIRQIYYDHYFQLIKIESIPRQNRCLNLIKAQFSYIFAFVLVMADDESMNDQKKIHEMVLNLRDAFEDTITKSTWLDSSTKMAALNKLQFITQIISYQDWMLNPLMIEAIYDEKIVIPGHHYSTIRLLKKDMRNRNLSYLGREDKKTNQKLTSDPADVNAAYALDSNAIDIPIGILGPPFYSLGLEALNYGSIGMIMAHELGHALDDMGKEYDSWGVKKKWWKKRTHREYSKRAECFVKSYSEIMIPAVRKKVDGKLTLGENIADNVGFSQALKAYRKFVEKHGEEDLLPHFEHYSHDKLFTMAFANLYCETTSNTFVRNQLENDEHSPARARILGVLRNSPEFARIWGCAEDAKMNPKEKCQLW